MARGWKIDVYLQANKSQEAVLFYKKIGFTKMNTNLVDELPEAWHDKVNNTKIKDLYIKPVDDATNLREAEERSKAEGKSKVSQSDFMHLYKVSSFVKVIQDLQESLNNPDDEVTMLPSSTGNMTDPIPLIPVDINDKMLWFPYKEQSQRVDVATKDLLILEQSLFTFIDGTNYSPQYQAINLQAREKNSLYKTATINTAFYYRLKARSARNKNEVWLKN